MNRQWAVQIFSLLAIVAGALISYFPPAHNAEAMWTLIGSFLGYGIRDLFGSTGLVGTLLAASAAPAPAVPPQGGQGGFARLPLLVLVALVAVAALALPGCATTAAGTSAAGMPPAIVAQTPTQIAARVCPALTVTVTNLQGLMGLSDSIQAKLDNAHQIVDVACGAGAVVNLTSLRTLMDSGIPALQDLVRGAGLPNDDANQLLLGLSVAQVVLAGLVDPLLAAP
jgi:hypothetical protein